MKYSIEEFIGRIDSRGELREMMLKDFLGYAWDNHYVRTTLDLRRTGMSTKHSMLDVRDIYGLIEDGYMIVPYSKTVSIKLVEFYLKAGFKIRFMRASDFSKMKKEYMQFA